MRLSEFRRAVSDEFGQGYGQVLLHDLVLAELGGRTPEAALAAGVPEVWIDPGIGFGKTVDHNLSLLKHLGVLVETGFPVVVGTSRKRFVQLLTGATGPDDALEGSLATAVVALAAGAGMVRVHDVRETVHAARIVG